MLTSTRLRFHYEHILRQDLLLKGQYGNILEVPRLAKAQISRANPKVSRPLPWQNKGSKASGKQTSAVSTTTTKGDELASRLARAMLCGQKGSATEQPETSRVKASLLRQSVAAIFKAKLKPQPLVRSCLRAQILYNFLEKLISTIAFYEFKWQINNKAIHFNIGTDLLRLFPEIQEHFAILESAKGVKVIIVTSAKSARETRLLWTGLWQKEF